MVLLLLLGCGEEDAWRHPSDVRAEVVADVATVARVSWRTEVPTSGYVEYGTGPEMEWSTPLAAKPALEHSQLLLGLRSDAAYSFRVIAWDGREALAGSVETVQTGRLPADIPRFEQAGRGFEGLVVLPLQEPNPGVVIVDGRGEVVWYHLDRSGLQPTRARLSADGSSVLYNLRNRDEDGPSDASGIVKVALDGSEENMIHVPFLGDDFVELPSGTLAALTSEPRDDGVRDDSIVEIDSDGGVTEVWSVSDCFDPAREPGDGGDAAGAHANALDYDGSRSRSERAYYVGLRNFSSIIKVSPETRECPWVLGATAGTLDLPADAAAFVHQSGFDVYGQRLLLMDNGAPPQASRVVEYELDLKAGTAAERQVYVEPNGENVGELGGVTRLVDGRWFINWASLGRAEVVDGSASVWQLGADGVVFGYHTLAETLYAADSRRP